LKSLCNLLAIGFAAFSHISFFLQQFLYGATTSLFHRCQIFLVAYDSRRRHQADGPDSSQSQGRVQQQQLVPVQDNYMQNRAEALQNVEATIVELSTIFTQLATMVAEQGEVAIR